MKACRHEWGTRGRAHGANGDGGAAGAAAPCCRPRGGAAVSSLRREAWASAGSPRLADCAPRPRGRAGGSWPPGERGSTPPQPPATPRLAGAAWVPRGL